MAEWIIPCNAKYYNVEGAFKKHKILDWKQSAKNIQIGDIVFIYVGSPVMSIMYKCKVNNINLKKIEIDDSEFILDGEVYAEYPRHMELELIKEFERNQLSLCVLRKHGLKGNIQGPRKVKDELLEFLSSDLCL